jgi:hypothetical protein
MPQTSNKKNEPNSNPTLHAYRVNATPKRNSILTVSCEQLKPVWNSAGRIPYRYRVNVVLIIHINLRKTTKITN